MNIFYYLVMISMVSLGYWGGFAGYTWTKWFAMPFFAYGVGALIKFIWAY